MVNRLDRFITWLGSSGPGNLFLIALVPIAMAFSSLRHDYAAGHFQLTSFLPMIIVWGMCALFLACSHGHPKNWWSPFFGIEMVVNIDRLAGTIVANKSYDVKQEVKDWVSSMSSGPYVQINPFKYKFLRKRDAAAFKLAWT